MGMIIMKDFSIKYWNNSENKFLFEDSNYELARRICMSTSKFNRLMVVKFNAIIPDNGLWNDDPAFMIEEDIKKAIEYLQPIIDGYWMMLALTTNF